MPTATTCCVPGDAPGGSRTGISRVVLTLIGDGVFENSIPLIWESINWALAKVKELPKRDLDVFLNGLLLGGEVDLQSLAPQVQENGGGIFTFDREGLIDVIRINP